MRNAFPFSRLPLNRLPGSLRLWLMLAVACGLAYSFFEIVDDVFFDPLEGDVESHEFDAAVSRFLTQFRSEGLTQAAIDLTALGSVSVLTVFAILAYAAAIGSRDFVGLAHLSIALLGAGLWPQLLKPLYGRERPDLLERLVPAADLSFPSGHAFGAAACYATFAYLCARYTQSHAAEIFAYVFAALLITVIGLTRIYLGVHYATDVLAGFAAGGAWAFLLAALFTAGQSRHAPPQRP
ncbi:MAG TPA: phosphatase PAP2 family protein [Pseudomonadales bacterium]